MGKVTWDDSFCRYINSLPKEKILDWSRLKAFADDKVNITYKREILFGMGRKHCNEMRKFSQLVLYCNDPAERKKS